MAGKGKLAIKPAIDISDGFDPPLDFTFMCLTTAADCLEEEPRDSINSPPKRRTRSSSSGERGEGSAVKRRTNAIRLSNNVITDWTDFMTVCDRLIENPLDLEWIDLSFNDVVCIDKCILQFKKLKVLYLHGNSLERISEIDKLAGLPSLHSLTLHGNPIEESVRGYRQFVLAKLPQLKNFDFSAVTKSDRANATWNQVTKPGRRKKKDY